jgi:hypothetical protein
MCPMLNRPSRPGWAMWHRPPPALSRSVSVSGLDELRQRGGRAAMLLLDLGRVVGVHAIEGVP